MLRVLQLDAMRMVDFTTVQCKRVPALAVASLTHGLARQCVRTYAATCPGRLYVAPWHRLLPLGCCL